MTLKSSAFDAELGYEFSFTCTVDNAEGLDDEVAFLKGSVVLASLHQSADKCAPITLPVSAHLGVRCSNGTYDSSAPRKHYVLEIREAGFDDQGEWKCALDQDGTASNTFRLHVHSKRNFFLFFFVFFLLFFLVMWVLRDESGSTAGI